jgi:predicted RNA-binding Zn-ribbon protein involved in translation (DUF1610 family)
VLVKSSKDECRQGTGSTNHDSGRALATAEEHGHHSCLPLGYSCGRAVLRREHCRAEGASYYRRYDRRLAVAVKNRKLRVASSCSRMVGARRWNDMSFLLRCDHSLVKYCHTDLHQIVELETDKGYWWLEAVEQWQDYTDSSMAHSWIQNSWTVRMWIEPR